MLKTRVGDKRERASCLFCGGPRYEVYREVPVYHNDVDYKWTPDGHGDILMGRVNYLHCIQYLRIRLEKLEALKS